MAAFLDGALTQDEDARWREHIRRCEKCRRALDELRSLMDVSGLELDPVCVQKGKSIVWGGDTQRKARLRNVYGSHATLTIERYN
ncbi:MAG: zf-HC2 domain-containing protein [Desulfovibrio sp.]|nr:zf-HC2 domain-containing protein [Desulfovibrio sp.]MBI4960874.1 zf-HC2 domain-containing protein [Desulfovibrio sp.]